MKTALYGSCEEENNIYATQATTIKSILIFFKLFSEHTCEHSDTNKIAKIAD